MHEPNQQFFRRLRALLGLAALAFGCGGGGSRGGSPTAPPSPPPPQVSPALVLRSAVLRGSNGHRTEGTAQIVRLGDRHSLELRDDFRTDPQVLEVRLCRDDRCDGAFLRLGVLLHNQGAQSYPMDQDGAAYSRVVIWCIPFRVPIGLGDLR